MQRRPHRMSLAAWPRVHLDTTRLPQGMNCRPLTPHRRPLQCADAEIAASSTFAMYFDT